MRPYLAIIKDSFRSAIASKVLYVLLILITLLLLVLIPLHVRETLDWKLVRQVNVPNGSRLINQLVKQRTKSEPVKRIWELLSPDLQKRLLAKVEPQSESKPQDDPPGQPGQPRMVREIELQEDLIEELNTIIERRDFYNEEVFGRRGLKIEARDLLDEGLDNLSDLRVKRLNRLLIATALTPHVDQGNPTALEIQYAIWKAPFPIQMTQQQFAQTLITYLPYYFDKFVLSIGLLIAIVVTANMVPETFEPGSLNLLLSKPISRWGLFTAKFLGGCVFIGLCAAYLFAGLWLWLGLGMGVWDRAILISIPLYIIVFAIYFSVSALIGLMYRSPIVSVILTLLFWVVCFVVGSVHGFFKIKADNNELMALTPAAGENLLSSDIFHQVSSWDASKGTWDSRLKSSVDRYEEQLALSISTFAADLRQDGDLPGLKDFLKPVFDHRSNTILCSRWGFQSGFGERPLYAADSSTLKFKPVGSLPSETLALYETPNGMVAVTGAGQFHQMQTDKFDEAFAKTETPAEKPTEDDAKTAPALSADELFVPLGPSEPEFIRSRGQVDYCFARDEFAVYEYGKLRVYRNAGKSYELRKTAELKLEFNTNMTAMLAFGKQSILIAFGNGRIFLIDADSLEQQEELQLENRSGLLEVAASPEGLSFGVLYRNGNLWVSNDDAKPSFAKASVAGQGSICTFTLGERNVCWIAYDSDRVAKYNLEDGGRELRLVPTGDFISRLFRYAIRPLYRVFPKPGEFYKVVTHLASTGDAAENQDVDWNKTVESSDPWGPLRSGLVFMFGMLAVGCTLFHFKDY